MLKAIARPVQSASHAPYQFDLASAAADDVRKIEAELQE